MTIRGVPDGSGSRKGSCRSFGIGKFAVASLTFARAAMMFLRRARSTATAASVARKSRNDLEDGCTKNSRACGRVQESLGRSSLTNCTSVDAFSAVMRIMRVSNSALLLSCSVSLSVSFASESLVKGDSVRWNSRRISFTTSMRALSLAVGIGPLLSVASTEVESTSITSSSVGGSGSLSEGVAMEAIRHVAMYWGTLGAAELARVCRRPT
mmetsp:Transcript_17749/g.30787  ORF Transcript_17749/g.30787 Transcript_17749/m.30787 type:complete len:211 (-) Transcript_17749:416-1048(-)